MMDNEKIWHLLILKLSGEATGEELRELDALMQRHPEVALRAASVETLWKAKGSVEEEDTEDLFNRHLQRLSDDTAKNTPFYHSPDVGVRSHRPRKLWLLLGATAVAACLVIVFLRGGVLPPPPGSLASGNFVSTKNGSKSKLQLPDGTQVWLNSGSNISYDNDFGGKTRQVQLTGEAFFDVAKDNARPFIIHTATVDVMVLGTAFNVRSYPEEKVTETSLIKGAVEVILKANADKKILLKPNEKLIVSNDSITVRNDSIRANDTQKKPVVMTLTQVHHLNKDSVASEVLWTKNKLVFDGETLGEVALKLERWYGVKVIIQGDELKNMEYTGVFDDDNLTEVLYALQLSGNFKYVIKRNEVIIKP
ncbi:MAG: FecR domain-containing protein [Chitinophagaceae bacterium]|nr:FecR domain-containing protein [Chitinophagaceae bacterium]